MIADNKRKAIINIISQFWKGVTVSWKYTMTQLLFGLVHLFDCLQRHITANQRPTALVFPNKHDCLQTPAQKSTYHSHGSAILFTERPYADETPAPTFTPDRPRTSPRATALRAFHEKRTRQHRTPDFWEPTTADAPNAPGTHTHTHRQPHMLALSLTSFAGERELPSPPFELVRTAARALDTAGFCPRTINGDDAAGRRICFVFCGRHGLPTAGLQIRTIGVFPGAAAGGGSRRGRRPPRWGYAGYFCRGSTGGVLSLVVG